MRNAMVMLLSILAALNPVLGIDIEVNNGTSVNEAQNLVLAGLLTYCPWSRNEPGSTPGMFQEPYYWWEAGVAWGAIIDWSAYTGNHTYDHLVKEAIQYQSGSKWNFMTDNQTSVEGNDDQAFWGVTAMNAAEKNFTVPDSGYPPWLYFAQATFNKMAGRWDNTQCNGGLRWQIYTWNAGYDYKNMVSNGCLFHLAARLTRFTNNETYIEWADRVWDWASGIGFLNPLNNQTTDPHNVQLQVLDGAHTGKNCTDITPAEWTYDQGLMISGCAYLYNYTGDTKWLNRIYKLWSRATILFETNHASWEPNKTILYEASCQAKDESKVVCSNDQRCFKGLMLRFLGQALQLVPELEEEMKPYIETTAQAASWSCSGGTDGHTCGLNWLHQGWDGWYGLGEQICALDAFNQLLVCNTSGPYTAAQLPEVYHKTTSNASTSSSNGSTTEGGGDVYGWGGVAGINNSQVSAQALDLDKGDVAGASILTAVVILFLLGGSAWLLI